MADPRAENCKAVTFDASGKVTGVELVFQPLPSTRYELKRVELIDEAATSGTTVANCVVLDKDGIETGERVWLAWPWPGMGDGKSLPGNPNGQHMMSGLPYNPPDIGPGGLYVGDAAGEPISDIIGGLGLPWNRHVSFRLAWKERMAIADPGPVGPLPEHEPKASAAVLADKVRWWLEESIRQDEAGNPARAAAIRYSLVKLDGQGLMYRLENVLKSGAELG
jgi:hypothetical protein